MKGELNNIRLNDMIMAGLYPKSLIQDKRKPVTSTEKPIVEVRPGKEVRFLGNNAQNITILVHNNEHTFLPEDQLSFLTKILGACKLNIGDVAIVNIANYHDAKEIIQSLHPSRIISFGTLINAENIELIEAPSIKEMINETSEAKTMKAKLWSELKKMFGV